MVQILNCIECGKKADLIREGDGFRFGLCLKDFPNYRERVVVGPNTDAGYLFEVSQKRNAKARVARDA